MNTSKWKDIPTTLVALVFFAISIYIGIKDWSNHNSWNYIIKVAATALLGWVFLNADRALLTQLFKRVFRIGKNNQNQNMQ